MTAWVRLASIFLACTILCSAMTFAESKLFAAGTKLVISNLPKQESLNLRSKASAASRALMELPISATDIVATGESEKNGNTVWVQVRVGKLVGWLNSDFVKVYDKVPTASQTDNQTPGVQKSSTVDVTSTDPIADCNSDDAKKKWSGCTLLIDDQTRSAAERAIAYSRRSDAAVLLNDLDTAMSDRIAACELEKNCETAKSRFAEALVLRAKSRKQKGDIDGALHDYGEVEKFVPQSRAALAGQASIHVQRGNDTDAIVALQKLGKTEGDNTSTNILLGQLLAKRAAQRALDKKFDEALLDYSEAVNADPSNAQLRIRRAEVLADKGASQDAISALNQALQLTPNSEDAYTRRAALFVTLNDTSHALEDLEQILKLNPKNISALLRRGLIYEGKGSDKQAAADYSAALRTEPKNQAAKEGLQRLKRATQDKAALNAPSAQSPTKNVTKARNEGASFEQNRACCLAYYRGERSVEGWGPSERCRRNIASIKADFCKLLKQSYPERVLEGVDAKE